MQFYLRGPSDFVRNQEPIWKTLHGTRNQYGKRFMEPGTNMESASWNKEPIWKTLHGARNQEDSNLPGS
jgi:hypothetical protein